MLFGCIGKQLNYCLALFGFQKIRPAWFGHENLVRFPEEYLTEALAPLGYVCQSTAISPQRFGKPMNRQGKMAKPSALDMTLYDLDTMNHTKL